MKDYQDRVAQSDSKWVGRVIKVDTKDMGVEDSTRTISLSRDVGVVAELLKEVEFLKADVASLKSRMSIIRSILGFEPDLGELSAYEIDRIMRQYE